MTLANTPQHAAGGYSPAAVYFADSDCVEYVKEDNFVIYHHVDDFLTIMVDETKIIPVGFKLKGFKSVFNMHLKSGGVLAGVMSPGTYIGCSCNSRFICCQEARWSR